MAENSIRERIVLRIIEELESVVWVRQVRRIRPTMAELMNYPATALPLITVEAQLPNPVEKKSSRRPGVLDVFVSELSVNIFCYILENKNPDSIISNYLDDLWATLYEDVLKNKLCIKTILTPEVETLSLAPYTAFGIDVTLTYLHTTSGI